MTFKDVEGDLLPRMSGDLLDASQRNLYRDVMLENYGNMASVGKVSLSPSSTCLYFCLLSSHCGAEGVLT